MTPDHVEVLETFFTKCPDWVDRARRVRFEEKLVAAAAGETPDTLRQLVDEALYPACGDRCEVHHGNQDFAAGGQTDITDLTLSCGPDNRLVGPGKWTTRINSHGRCEWTPPPLPDTGQSRINNHHHPQHYFTDDNNDHETDCHPA